MEIPLLSTVIMDDIITNRKAILKNIDSTIEDTVFMVVEMKDGIKNVDSQDKGKGGYRKEDALSCDAMITNSLDTTLYLCVADCLPILIHDPKKDILAIVHGGWPNTDLKIVEKVIKKMEDEYSCEISDLKIIIGPGIQKESLIYDKNIF